MKIVEEEEIKNISIDNATRADVDSDEELYFVWFLQDLKEAGVILDADINQREIPLSIEFKHGFEHFQGKKTLYKKEHVFRPTVYTPDFNIQHNLQYREAFYSLLLQGKKFPGQKIPFLTLNPREHGSVIEVKADFDANRSTGHTLVKIKWVWEKYQMFVQLVKVPSFFEDTFTPKKYLARESFQKMVGPKGKKELKTVKPPKPKWKVKTIEEFVIELNAAKLRLENHVKNQQQPLLP